MEKEFNPKIAVAISLQQHSYKTAEALEQNGMLYKYYTTVFYDKESIIYRLLKRYLNSDLTKRMQGKYSAIFSAKVSKYYEFLGLLFLFVIRKDHSRIILPKIKGIMNILFGVKIAKECIKHNIDVVIMYDTLAYYSFKKLKNSSAKTKRVLDMASVSAPHIRDILLRELESETSFKDSLQLSLKQYSRKLCLKYEKEIQLADYFLVACTFAKKTLIELGVKDKQIYYLPLGAEVDKFLPIKKKESLNKTKLKFLFVGRVEAAKGIFYLLNAFKELINYDIELDVVGAIKCNSADLEIYGINVNFLGNKRKEEMPAIYTDADVYILSSLWEGFSLSLFEALSSGLPVIATDCSCAPDVLTELEEGFTISSANITELKEKIVWFVNNKEKIPEMGLKSRELAKRYTWEKYSENLTEIIKSIVIED
ncbi:D-inositol-3-phosphate glycosyltransferase [Paenibacillus allorhizoplanae]|uniref:D-inositol-3-phosphate glycosyltransferase n=1 Tax=Paenibacillus allorhizoplanae TaxID=2905648 RepID=A0ABM9D0S9_9BACL|nr:glycosyltransferase family 4 protein [Paenibacillus allorhizoplanae]CAH1232808.1 D-inositol-3-phosphate glycosyltransferase [Paenibacillus allorhizoplanae]